MMNTKTGKLIVFLIAGAALLPDAVRLAASFFARAASRAAFAAAARLSDINLGLYRAFVQPWVRLMTAPPVAEALWQQHFALWEAIRARAPEQARDIMYAHIDFVRARLVPDAAGAMR